MWCSILNTLNQALESSGVNLSQANISVQINLRKRVTRRATATTMSSAKVHSLSSIKHKVLVQFAMFSLYYEVKP